jgi:hypothetical protein
MTEPAGEPGLGVGRARWRGDGPRPARIPLGVLGRAAAAEAGPADPPLPGALAPDISSGWPVGAGWGVLRGGLGRVLGLLRSPVGLVVWRGDYIPVSRFEDVSRVEPLSFPRL